MAISPQLPQMVVPLRPGALQALALQAGQVLDARIIGPAPNGGTQVQLAGRMLNLVLPVAVDAGATIKLEVQTSGAQIKLALHLGSAQPLQAQPSQLSPLPAPTAALPLPQAVASQAGMERAPAAALSGLSAQQATVPAVRTSSPTASTLNVPGTMAPLLSEAPPVPNTAAQMQVQPRSSSAAAAISAPPALRVEDLAASKSSLPNSAPLRDAPATAIPRTVSVPYPISPHPHVPASVSLASTPALKTDIPAQAAPAPLQAPAVAPSPPSSAATTPKAALAQMVQTSLPRQDSIASLMSALSAVTGKVALPEPVARAIGQVMMGRLPIEAGKLNGAGLKQAVLNSGVFDEALIAQGQVPTGPPSQKSSLLQLHQALTNWLGPQSPLAPAGQIAPPIRGQVPRARSSEAPPIDLEAEPQDIGKHLLERTEGSLSRLRLHQNASLPDPAIRTSADWSMDLPVLVGTQQTVLHMAIHRDPEQQDQVKAERGWQMRFALSLPQLGEAGAQVSLRGGTTGVMLWARERQTSEALEAHVMALRQTLAELGLRPGTVIVRHGEPSAAPSVTGHFLDEQT